MSEARVVSVPVYNVTTLNEVPLGEVTQRMLVIKEFVPVDQPE